MDYGPITGFSNRDMKCKYCVDITLKVVGIVALTVFLIMTITGTVYGVKMYNRVFPLIGLIENNIKNITVVFNQVSNEIMVYGKNITTDINSIDNIFKIFTVDGLKYIKVMANDLNKIATRIGSV